MNFILVLGREVPVYLVVEWQTKKEKGLLRESGLEKEGRFQAKRNKRRGEGGGEEPR